MKEGKEKGLPWQTMETFINPEIHKFEQERKLQREEAIEKRTNELMIDIPEGLKNLKRLDRLELTISDGILIQDLMIQVFDVHPENVHLLASEADANEIIKHVRVGDEESKEKQFYEDAKDYDEKRKWL